MTIENLQKQWLKACWPGMNRPKRDYYECFCPECDEKIFNGRNSKNAVIKLYLKHYEDFHPKKAECLLFFGPKVETKSKVDDKSNTKWNKNYVSCEEISRTVDSGWAAAGSWIGV